MSQNFVTYLRGLKSLLFACKNAYNSGGSKLNETARSYKMLASEPKKVNGVTFILFTDGTGWKGARKSIEETFNE